MLVIHPEYLSHAPQERKFLLVHRPVGLRDMEEAVDDVFEDRAIPLAGGAERSHFLRIGLVAGNVLAGEIVKPGDVLRLVRGKLEDVAKGAHLGLVHDAVGLRHFRRKGDHGKEL